MVLGVVLAVFVLFAFAILWNPAVVLALAFCSYSFEQWAQANSTFFTAHASYINFGFGILTLWALICIVLRGSNPLNPATNAMWAWLALTVYAAISCLWSPDRDTSIFLFRYHLPYIVTFSALIPMVIQKPGDVERGFIGTLAFGTVVCTLLLISTRNHAWGRTIEVSTAVVDRLGQERNRLSPLAVAEMAGQLVIIAVLMNFRGVNRIWQLLRWGVAFLALALIFRSGSRGQLIAALMSILMCITFSRGTKKAVGWVAAGISVMMIFGFVAWSFVGFAEQSGRWDMSNMKTNFADTRMDYVVKLTTYWLESSPINWMFGLGSSASFDPNIVGRYCHVVLVEIVAELGMVGLLIFLLWNAFLFRDGIRLYGLTKNSDAERGVGVTMIALAIYQLILTFKQGSYLNHYFSFGIWLMMSRQTAVMQNAHATQRLRDMKRYWYEYFLRFRSDLPRATP